MFRRTFTGSLVAASLAAGALMTMPSAEAAPAIACRWPSPAPSGPWPNISHDSFSSSDTFGSETSDTRSCRTVPVTAAVEVSWRVFMSTTALVVSSV